jgi:hypothetical protein
MYDHLNHVQQQFKQREIKIELQGFKSVYTRPGTLQYHIEAYNEYLLLTNSRVLPIGTRILSDTNSMEIKSGHRRIEALEEFSGLVSIELPQGTTYFPIIEFIQIVKE